jgi:hypothetical protein
MDSFALAGAVCAAIAGIGLLAAGAARVVDAALDAPQRALVVAVAFAAGFCTATLFFFVRL